jgi:hypothetical protein
MNSNDSYKVRPRQLSTESSDTEGPWSAYTTSHAAGTLPAGAVGSGMIRPDSHQLELESGL